MQMQINLEGASKKVFVVINAGNEIEYGIALSLVSGMKERMQAVDLMVKTLTTQSPIIKPQLDVVK